MSVDLQTRAIKRNLKQRGRKAMLSARKGILRNFKDESYCSQALRYFSTVTLSNALPVFPALISMSCEAAGGDCEKTNAFGEAIVLISAAADLHDDVIDQSIVKGNKQTVLGKFNTGVTILAGDILLFQGLRQLTDAGESIGKRQATDIKNLASAALFEISKAEGLEIKLHRRFDLTPDKYFEVIRLKAVIPELAMKIGALLAPNCDSELVDNLGEFGRTFGINSILFEEFADMLDFNELTNRLKNECLPLPIIYALQNQQAKNVLLPLLTANTFDKKTHKKIVYTVLEAPELNELQEKLISNAKNQAERLSERISEKMREQLKDLLLVPLNVFEG